jgi:uncharacterized lipoprotein YajG
MRMIVLLAFALAGCTNTDDPILYDDKCVASHSEMMLMPVVVSCGTNCVRTQMMIMPRKVCDRTVRIAYPNPDYAERSK